MSETYFCTPSPATPEKGRVRAFTVFEANCGVCGNYETPSSASRKGAESVLRKEGWSNTKRHGWVCPTCLPLSYRG